jgi:hypothetical protein
VDTSKRMSRRSFTHGGAALALLSAASVSLARAVLAAPPWGRSRFTPFRGATFQMASGTDAVDVVLTEISELKPVLRPDDEKRFALLFVAARDHAPADGIRTFRRAGFGEIDLFVSPVGRPVNAVHYQAIVNRL